MPPRWAAFPPSVPAPRVEDARAATDPSQGHGRVERRTITATAWLDGYLSNGPGVGPVFRLERQRKVNGKVTVEVVYGITSLSRSAADAGPRLGYSRRHWGIENGSHDTRDVTLGEDRCRVRRGHAPRAWASLRNVAVYLLRNAEYPRVAAATRAMVAQPGLALDRPNAPAPISE